MGIILSFFHTMAFGVLVGILAGFLIGILLGVGLGLILYDNFFQEAISHLRFSKKVKKSRPSGTNPLTY